MKKDNPTMESIAKSLGISKVSVHKALNNLPGVSPALKEKILSAAKNAGYVFKPRSEQPTRTYCYILRRKYFFAKENFYTAIFYYLDIECKNHNDQLELVLIDNDAELSDKDFEKYSGIFIAGEIGHKNFLELEKIHSIHPVVCVDYFSYKYPFHYVFIESFRTSYHAVETLIKMGHTKIGFVGNIDLASTVSDRYFGYLKALMKHGIEPKKEWHINENIEKMSPSEITVPDNLPSAFFCHCDMAAQQLQLKLAERGLKVPDDVSLVGFDNTELCKELSPQLTSIGVNKLTIAKESYSVMHRAFLSDRQLINELFPHIIMRDSVKDLSTESDRSEISEAV